VDPGKDMVPETGAGGSLRGFMARSIDRDQMEITATPTRPPSTSMTVPWTKLASSLAR